MRLYLYGKSKYNIGYTPDWLKVMFEEDGQAFELVLDIQGSIDYLKDSLSCRCKGDLIPWVLWNCETGDETDLSLMDEEEIETMFPDKRIAEIICNSDTFEIGVYPVSDSDETFELAEKDKLSNCKGTFEMYIDEEHYYEKEFEFDVELNI